MNFRDSTQLWGASHTEGAQVFATASSHGVEISGGSTGGLISAVGDDANIALNLVAKGTGAVNVGSTNSGLFLNSSGVTIGSASTTGVAKLQRYRIDWTVPALSSAGLDAASVDSTITVVGATTNGIYVVQRRGALNSTNSTGLGIAVCCSTADEIRLTSYNIGASTISGSTMSAYLLQISF